MKTIIINYWREFIAAIILIIIAFSIVSCQDFVEVDMPNSQLPSDGVFESNSTANAAVANLYAQMREGGFLSGGHNGLTFLLGLYSDELTSFSSGAEEAFSFFTNNLLPSNGTVQSHWNSAYNQIYAANVIIAKAGNSQSLTEEQKAKYRGEALFFRGLNHFYLAQLFGDVPYVVETDYKVNSAISKMSYNDVMTNVIIDLEDAANLLPVEYSTEDRARVNKDVAKALLARIYLYNGMWAEASNMASAVINNPMYELDTIESKFLRGSTETVWQLASAYDGKNTEEGALFIIESAPPQTSAITNALLEEFEAGDLRKQQWLGSVSSSETWYFPLKYKERNDTASSLEFSIVFRLSELYLIRAEARIRQGELSSGKDDLDAIRAIAGLGASSANTQTDLLTAVLHERQVELFTEQGHRFFDLKRFGKVNEALSFKPSWSATDVLWPLPQADLLLNSNLLPQNTGY